MNRSMIRELVIATALSLSMTVSLSYGAVTAIDHLLGTPDEIAMPAMSLATVDAD